MRVSLGAELLDGGNGDDGRWGEEGIDLLIGDFEDDALDGGAASDASRAAAGRTLSGARPEVGPAARIAVTAFVALRLISACVGADSVPVLFGLFLEHVGEAGPERVEDAVAPVSHAGDVGVSPLPCLYLGDLPVDSG